ncbi:hypothetical protein AJ79_10052 [Helicocarpus griseus UAMH5409]|uniref:DNA-directed RNA polymerase I subunit RPA34.5 n=1 Tax=Helicocarpus griseus UAMH5409 TaxID=1447875 RepID=A0A2B7WFZ2_9EURO|nr:hypothetical protein AJ79_10052 [Helicocarpus griseus UAMH5409]
MAPQLSKEIISESESSSPESSSSESVPQTKSTSKKSAEKTKPKKQPAKEVKRPVEVEESSSSDVESESEEESESSDQAEPSDTEKSPAIPASIPAQEFKAPEGFKLLSKNAPRSSDVSRALSDLRGKQLWHITAPASVPMNSIKELALDAVATGQPILTHKGANYRLREDQVVAEKNKTLLLPDRQGNTYHRSNLNIAQTFHLERIVDLANGTTHSEQSVQISDLTRPKREQPENLRMRYKPFGSKDDQSGSESEDEVASFRVPPTVSGDREGKKRRKSSMEVGSDNEQGERRKKHKKIHADGGAGAGGEASPSKSKKAKDEATPRGRKTEQFGEKSSKKRDETSQERRARREERKRKKQASS